MIGWLIAGAAMFLVGSFLGWVSALLSVQFSRNLLAKTTETVGEDRGE